MNVHHVTTTHPRERLFDAPLSRRLLVILLLALMAWMPVVFAAWLVLDLVGALS